MAPMLTDHIFKTLDTSKNSSKLLKIHSALKVKNFYD